MEVQDTSITMDLRNSGHAKLILSNLLTLTNITVRRQLDYGWDWVINKTILSSGFDLHVVQTPSGLAYCMTMNGNIIGRYEYPVRGGSL